MCVCVLEGGEGVVHVCLNVCVHVSVGVRACISKIGFGET